MTAGVCGGGLKNPCNCRAGVTNANAWEGWWAPSRTRGHVPQLERGQPLLQPAHGCHVGAQASDASSALSREAGGPDCDVKSPNF